MMKPRDQKKFEAARRLQLNGNFGGAIELYQGLLRAYPRDGDLLESAGRTYINRGHYADAEKHLTRLNELEPERVTGLRAMALLRKAQEDMDAAMEMIDRAIALDPNDHASFAAKAELAIIAGRFELAGEIVTPLIEAGDRQPGIVMAFADLAPKIDQRERAIEVLGEVIAAHSTTPAARVALLYRRASLRESLGLYDEAFGDAKRANAGVRPRFNTDSYKKMVDAYLSLWTPETFAGVQPTECDDNRPVFIIGMPRSGTSLTEQILGRHPRIAPGGERATVLVALREMKLLPQPDAELPTSEQIEELSRILVEDHSSISTDAAITTDKMPTNFQFVPYIAKALPRARFIHCRRDPLDSCISCFMLGFSPPVAWSNSLETVGLFNVWYRQLIEAWEQLDGIRMHTVYYEDLASDPEPQIRSMLEFLGLEFDEACLNPEESSRVVYTASNEQVRKKIGTGSVGRHKRFEAHLGPLRAVLDGAQ